MTVIRRLVEKMTLLLLALASAALSFPLILRAGTAALTRPLETTSHEVGDHDVAIIFGARIYPSGRPSAMLYDRVKTGVDLYLAGRVDTLLMTGDGRALDYNEPEAMKALAMEFGVPEEAILVDPLGLRTYDSCYRAANIYGITDAVLATQGFHLDRALLTCSAFGIDVEGISVDYQRPTGYSERSLTYSQVRELPATVVAVYDLLTRPTPEAALFSDSPS